MTLLLVGCSQTSVHLYSRYLSEQQIDSITQELVNKEFLVIANQHVFPDLVETSSIIYSPFIENAGEVNKLISTMQTLGWEIFNTSMLFNDNHHYKKNSIALLLVPEGTSPHAESNSQNWAHKYASQQCDTSITIHLEVNGQYRIDTPYMPQNENEYAQGGWKIIQFPYLELRPKQADWGYYFQLKSYTQTDVVGDIQLFELMPVENYKIFANCTFIHGIRS